MVFSYMSIIRRPLVDAPFYRAYQKIPTFITDETADDFICLGGGCAGCSTFCSTASTRRLRPLTATCGLFTGSSWSFTLYLIIHGLGLRVETDLCMHLNFLACKTLGSATFLLAATLYQVNHRIWNSISSTEICRCCGMLLHINGHFCECTL
jgi:hypothetical protein